MLVYARDVRPGGRTDVLSRPRLSVSSGIAFSISSLFTVCSAEFLPIGAAGRVFPVATDYDFQFSAELPYIVFDYRVKSSEDGFDGHCFRGGSGNRSVQSLNVVMWMREHWSVLSSIHALNHERSYQPPRVSTLHV